MPTDDRPDVPPRVAVLVPCYNEEVSIGQVVAEFQTALPDATVYVYDNNSSDATVDRAREAGAVVRHEARQGKGNVVRRMFGDVDADVYVMVDGDATYDAASAPAMVERLWTGHLDMVVGRRVHEHDEAYRAGHQTGNRLLTGFLGRLFGRQFTDILSGYRVFSRRFVKTFPADAAGSRSRPSCRSTRSRSAPRSTRWTRPTARARTGPRASCPRGPTACASRGRWCGCTSPNAPDGSSASSPAC